MTHLESRLDSLKNRFESLREEVQDLIDDLDEGVPPDKSIAYRLHRLKSDFENLREDAVREAEEAPLSGSSRSLSDLEYLVGQVATTPYEEMYGRAEKRIQKLKQVADQKSSDHSALASVREEARNLASKLDEPEKVRPHDEVKNFVEDDHPLASFEALAFQEKELSDEEFMEAREAVEEHFDARASIAATRGRVTLKTDLAQSPEAGEDGENTEGMDTGAQEATEETDEANTDSKQEGPTDKENLPGQSADEEEEDTSKDVEDASEDVTDTESEEEGDSTADGSLSTEAPEQDQESEELKESSAENDVEIDAKSPSTEDLEGKEEDVEEDSLDSSQESGETTTESEESERSGGQISPIQEDAIKSLSQRILREGISNSESIGILTWSLLHNRLDGLAFHSVQNAEELGAREFPSRLIRDYALAKHLRGRRGDLAQYLQFAETTEVVTRSEAMKQDGRWHLAFSAALRPALHAPAMTSVLDLIELLQEHGGPETLRSILDAVGSFIREHYRPISPRALNSSGSGTSEEEFEEYQRKFEKWASATQKRKAPYWRATKAWRTQFDKGPVAKILEEVRDGTPTDNTIRNVRENLEDLRGRDLQRIYSESTEGTEELDGKALTWFRNSFNEFESWVTGWIDLAEQLVGDEETPYVEQSYALVEKLQGLASEAREELSSTAPDTPSQRVALDRTLEVVKDLEKHFQEDSFGESEPSVQTTLRADLLRVPGLRLDADLTMKEAPRNSLKTILQVLQEGYLGWEDAFWKHEERDDHLSTKRILQHLRKAAVEAEREEVDVEALRQERDESVTSCRRKVNRHAKETERTVERAFRAGYLDRSERADYLSQVQSVEQKVEEKVAFHRLQETLRTVEAKIEDEKQEALDQVRARLESDEVQSVLTDSPEDRQRINQAIEREDVRTADAYIHRILEGQDIPSPKRQETALEDFFPERLTSIIQEFDDPSQVQDLLTILKSGEQETQCGPLDLQTKEEEQVRSAEVVETWLQARRNRNISTEQLEKVLIGLGFSPKSVEIESMGKTIPPGRKSRWAAVDIDVPSKRDVPVPEYGSNTGGRYRILLAYGNPAVEELADDIEHIRPDGEKAMVAFYFGNIDVEERRQLDNLCRERRSDFIVVDQALLLYLLARPRSSRLLSLYECTLPFSFLQPYSESASRIPREMFFGREREIEKLHRTDGPSIVYGGRQLGKTVLLRRAQRLFHNPPKRVSSWVDLRRYGISSKDPKSVWPIIVDELKELGVFDKGESRDAKPKNITRKIESWLEENQERRILLLLDEADSFFRKDQQNGFEQTSALKGLMEATDGRFKVVFAGLHNVLRTTNAPNQPLAHLREPICVGPLLKKGEWKSAQNLISEPLRALGYRFEPEDDLITYILSLTNYYPSLIQLYCRHLLEEVSERSALQQPDGPPYVIGRSEVQHSSDQRDLMRQIRHKFLLTLQLDPRYEVLAYVIGYETRKSGEDSTQGFEVESIAAQARTYWPDGFRGSDSREHVQALLDEMVGLGVLRNIDNRRYALRSPNVLPLLGDKDKMEEVLLKERSPLPEYDPKTHRRFYGRENRISPLTEHQHALLKRKGAWPQSSSHGVAVIYGTKAAGLENVRSFLKGVSDKNTFHVADDLKSAQDFDEWMREKKEGRSKSEVTLLFVSQEAPWGEGWVDKAVRQAERLSDQRAALRIAFMADPERLSKMCQEGGENLFPGQSTQVLPIQLQPWDRAALRDWMVDRGKKPTKSELQDIRRVTGNWPLLLRMLEEDIRRDPGSLQSEVEALGQKLDDPEVTENLLSKFGLPESIRRNVLRVLALLGGSEESSEGVIPDNLSEIVADTYGEALAQQVEPVLRWASLVGVASSSRGNKWSVDPIVERLLLTVEE